MHRKTAGFKALRRAVAPHVPIGVALDMHTNLYDAMGQNATVMAGYQTYPHVDMYETGLRAGRAVLALLAGWWGLREVLQRPVVDTLRRAAE